MFGDGSLTFREFVMGEAHPLATIHSAVLEFLRGRDDASFYGAHAVNANVDEPRMTQGVDLLSTRAEELAEELRAFLNRRFHIAVRVRSVKGGIGYRIYQLREPRNRHLVEVRAVESLPATKRVQDVLVLAPPELIASKLQSAVGRLKTAKGLTDSADLRRLLLAFPHLKTDSGPVRLCLRRSGNAPDLLAAWSELVAEDIQPDDDDSGF
jgi:hypothetical protein